MVRWVRFVEISAANPGLLAGEQSKINRPERAPFFEPHVAPLRPHNTSKMSPALRGARSDPRPPPQHGAKPPHLSKRIVRDGPVVRRWAVLGSPGFMRAGLDPVLADTAGQSPRRLAFTEALARRVRLRTVSMTGETAFAPAKALPLSDCRALTSRPFLW
jgi:hypothetical protein